jgi:uncharacterized membrane protein
MTSPQTNYLHDRHAQSPSSNFWKAPTFWIGSGVALLGFAFRGRTRIALLGAGGALAGMQASTKTKSTLSSHGTILLQCSPEEAFDFWSDSSNLPRFMRNVQSVQPVADGRFRWTLRDPSGKEIDSLVEVATEKPSRIEWHSPNGASPVFAGRVEFRSASGNRGTIVSATVQYPRSAVGFIPTMEPGDIMGHEFMGEVVEVGSGVPADKLKVGDRVVVPFTIACGKCFFCQRELWSCCDNSNPNYWIAEKMMGYSPSGLFGYTHMMGGYAGGQAQYARVPFADVGPLKLPPELPDEQVVLLSDILPTAYMGALNCNVEPGDTV